MIDLALTLRDINRLRLPATALDSLLDVQPEPVTRIPVTAGTRLQSAIDAAPDDAELLLEPGIYDGTVTIQKPISLVAATGTPRHRVATDRQLPVVIQSPSEMRMLAPRVRLAGLTLRVTAPDQQILNLTGSLGTQLDAVQVLGDPHKGQRRGIRWDGVGTFMRRSVVDHCWRVGGEAQAVMGGKGRDGRIDDCTLCGASQSVMWGGVDAPSEAESPRNHVISRSLLTKRREWYAIPNCYLKCAYELKNAFGCRLEDSIGEYAGTSENQKGFLAVLTPRNQDGKASWSAVRDSTIERCLFRYGGGCVNLMGSDDRAPSGLLENLSIRHCRFDHIDPLGITKGQGWCVLIQRAPVNVTLESITISGKNIKALLYGVSATSPPPRGLRLHNVVTPLSVDYGIKIDNGGMGLDDLLKWAPDTIIDDGPMTGARGYPSSPDAQP
jgi:hypothetical protein